ncbi:MAG: YvcK family protein [Chloroflexi bacterium]|nr:YvcK family protein [Chloroflexota bacterium]
MKPTVAPWSQRLRDGIIQFLRWFTPGLGVKRWLLLVLLGTSLIGTGLAILVLDVYRTSPDTWWLPALSTISLRSLARPLRALIFGGLGIGLIVSGIWGLNRSLLAPFLQPGRPFVETLAGYRRRGRGPRIVAIGGGHGLSILLRGLKEFTHNLTAVVTVADDGGSSGRLRDSLGILPPGDIRNCLAALSNDEALITQLFQYRFANGGGGLDGHSFGNLFISALSEITGSFEDAVAESGRVLSVHGRVLPSTLHDVRLVADMSLPHLKEEVRIRGESRIPSVSGEVRRIWLEPNNPPAFPEAIKALLGADLIILGPGSLYTSILPNLLVPDFRAAVRSSQALKIYVCNVATQLGETDAYTCNDHIKALDSHVGTGIFDLVVCNKHFIGDLPDGAAWVEIEEGLDDQYAIYQSDLGDDDAPGRHDAGKLSRVLIDILQERTGPLAL